jgi:hypothetical protein
VALVVLVALWRGWSSDDFGDFFWIGLGWLVMVPLLRLVDRWAHGLVSGLPDDRRSVAAAMLPVGVGFMVVGGIGWFLARR